jgi:hypothetical protein
MTNSERYKKHIKEKNATALSGGDDVFKLTNDQLGDLLGLLLADEDWDWISEICLGYDIDQVFTRDEQEDGTSAECLQEECLMALVYLNKRGGLIAWIKEWHIYEIYEVCDWLEEHGLEKHLEELGILRKYDKEGNKI